MSRFTASTGRLLGSAALRYREPICARRMSGSERAGKGWFLLSGGVIDDAPAGRGLNGRNARLARLEAVLMLARQPEATRKLAQLAGLADGTKARTLVRALNRLYDAEGSAFRVEEVAGGFQLRTRAQFAPWLKRLHTAAIQVRLSPPAMETLAVVAYRQPVLRAEIEAVRGVHCGEVLRQLIERELVRIAGRSEELGRPFLYGTTKRFLQIFGLRHLDELPRVDALRGAVAKPDAPGAHHADNQLTNQTNHCQQTEEEEKVKILDAADIAPEELSALNRIAPAEPDRDQHADDGDLSEGYGLGRDDRFDAHDDDQNGEEYDDYDHDDGDHDDDEQEYDEDDYDEDDYDEDDYDDDEEEEEEAPDDDLEDDPWEEVEDDEQEEDEEDEDEDYDDEDWDDDEQWNDEPWNED